jgi:hypothetical protein
MRFRETGSGLRVTTLPTKIAAFERLAVTNEAI